MISWILLHPAGYNLCEIPAGSPIANETVLLEIVRRKRVRLNQKVSACSGHDACWTTHRVTPTSQTSAITNTIHVEPQYSYSHLLGSHPLHRFNNSKHELAPRYYSSGTIFTAAVSQAVRWRYCNRWIGKDLEGTGRDLKVLSMHLPERTRENHENVSQDSRWTSKRELLKHWY
jgi:hypothetical protein